MGPTSGEEKAIICGQLSFRPGRYDDEFHRLDGDIDTFARSLPGFDRVKDGTAAPLNVRQTHRG